MFIMPSRYEGLIKAMAGLDKTGVPFLGFDGRSFVHPHFGDDEGIYFFIPKIAHAFHLSLPQAIDFFFLAILFGSVVAGIAGILLSLKTAMGRTAGITALCILSAISYRLGDVYMVSSSTVIGIVPLFLYTVRDKHVSKIFVIFLLLGGVVLGSANIIRAHAGTAVAVFMLAYLLFMQRDKKVKIVLVALMLAGIIIPLFSVNLLLNKRDAFLLNQRPGLETAERRHVFWHSAYIGLGFLNNPYGIRYQDEVAINKVHSLAPEAAYLSRKYEQTLKNEVLAIIRKDPVFIVMTLSAKACVILFYLGLFANVGLIAAYFNGKDMPRELGFGSALLFSSLPGFLVMPYPNYLLGFIAFAVLYGIVHIDTFISSGRWKRVRTYPAEDQASPENICAE